MQQQEENKTLNEDKAIPFDVIRYRQVDKYTDKQIRKIVDTVWNSLPLRKTPKKKDKKKYREMVKNYVLNLIKSDQTGRAIRVSRNRNDHHYVERYSHIYTTPRIVIKTMDTLKDKGWIDMQIGFYDKQQNKGKQTRITPTEKFQTLIKKFLTTQSNKQGTERKYLIFEPVETKEVIQLRHKLKNNKYELIPYKDTTKTIKMRERLIRYNIFMKSSSAKTHLKLTREELINMKSGHRETLNNMMINRSIIPIATIPTSQNTKNKYTSEHNILSSFHHKERRQETNHKEEERHKTKETSTKHTKHKQQPNTITKTLDRNYLCNQAYNSISWFSILIQDSIIYSVEDLLDSYPDSDIFWFEIAHRDMYRAFSDTSKSFEHHGRFYGDPVQNLPRWMRTKITMGYMEVVECDFTSLHPTMLYVMAGEIPPDNIYILDKNKYPDLRKEIKTILLVSINHKNPDTLWSAVSKHFREEFGYKAGDERLTKESIMELYNEILAYNEPIAKYMNTGVAMDLMRKDSEIADRVLNEFVSLGVPIRCIHDSFIVPAIYEDELKESMVRNFQEVMGTDYVIGITTETSLMTVNEYITYRGEKNVEILPEHDKTDEELVRSPEDIHGDQEPCMKFIYIPNSNPFDVNSYAGIRFHEC